MSERIYVTEIMNAPQEPDVSLARCRVPVGVTTQLHSLSVTEWYMIEAGIGVIEIDGVQAEVRPGDCLRIAPSQSQRITNTGEEDLIFMTLCQPRFVPECYRSLEKDL